MKTATRPKIRNQKEKRETERQRETREGDKKERREGEEGGRADQHKAEDFTRH